MPSTQLQSAETRRDATPHDRASVDVEEPDCPSCIRGMLYALPASIVIWVIILGAVFLATR